METALLTLGEAYLDPADEGHVQDWKIVHAFGLCPEFLAMTQVWDTSDGLNDLVVAAKGAPKAIFGLCRLKDSDRMAQTRLADAMAAEGLRVLGVARAAAATVNVPGSPDDLESALWDLWGWPTPCGSQCLQPSPKATAPAFASS